MCSLSRLASGDVAHFHAHLRAEPARQRALLTLLRMEWKRAWIGGINRVGSYALMLWAMTLAPVTKLAALRESSVIFAALLGHFLLREPFDRRRVVATALVLMGILTLQLAR